MLGTTHQLIALLAALWLATLYPVHLGPILGTIAVIAVMIGALTPDLDQPAANLWRRMLAGRAIGNIFQMFSGGHRHLTHSFIGIIGIALLLRWSIHTFVHPNFVPEATILWYAYMIGYISHPIADTLTDLGVPWFWPFPLQIKIPPGSRALRVTTGSFVETILFRVGIVIAATLILRTHWETIWIMFK
ncbi:MAG: metal-dependent hydrolase [Candidatus Andersenbacteria bacterium]